VILVIGRPALGEGGRLAGTCALVCLAASEAGARVELVGSVGDDLDGDEVAVALGRAGVGHAALLRDPAGATPHAAAGSGEPAEPAEPSAPGPLPRLDARDIELGLLYLTECRVLVVAEPLEQDGLEVARDAARYHAAKMVVIVADGAPPPVELAADATVLSAPVGDGGAFAAVVGRYAAALADGRPADEAWQAALSGSEWSASEEPGATGER
jgi:sugar/nucleoside kinase (ribokinase family)